MKIKLFILLGLLSILDSNAHKNRVVYKTYGNIKVYAKTAFDYSELDKIKIIGKLSEKIAQKLNYKDTLLIEYIHQSSNSYVGELYMLEQDNSNFRFLTKIISENFEKKSGSGLSVRIHNNRLNIVETLKVIEFAINNRKKLNTYLKKEEVELYSRNSETIEIIKTIATSKTLINLIKSRKSELIDEIIKNKLKVKGQEHFGIEIYWMNDLFKFEYKHIHNDEQEFIFELKDYYYSINVNNNIMLVFIDKNNFYYLNIRDKNKKVLNSIENGTKIPVQVMIFDKKLLIYNNSKNLNIFLTDKNKTISKFE